MLAVEDPAFAEAEAAAWILDQVPPQIPQQHGRFPRIPTDRLQGYGVYHDVRPHCVGLWLENLLPHEMDVASNNYRNRIHLMDHHSTFSGTNIGVELAKDMLPFLVAW